MNAILRIRLEDGLEDGLELNPALLKKLGGGEDNVGADISFFVESEESGSSGPPYLLGCYCLVEVVEGTARYRWRTA